MMKKEDYKIYVVGAGISGLIAAQVLENHGYAPTILESETRAGGRVQSDKLQGYTLDRGFQVLLTAYPAAKKYLNYKALELQEFLPGAAIFKDQKTQTIGDPLRNLSLLLPTVFSSIGNLSDKIKVLRLNRYLKKKSISEIFTTPETTTLAYLEDYGFSKNMIASFFTPFFAGIFLESTLETSSRMFEFIYKMFGEGNAALPKKGIQAITDQLVARLTNTTFEFQTRVQNVTNGSILLTSGEKRDAHFTIIATEPNSLISNLKNQDISWKSCDTLYFETDTRAIEPALIGLIPGDDLLINNIFYHTSIANSTTTGKELLSVTVVKQHDYTEEDLLAKVKSELKIYCGIEAAVFLKRYHIPKALPNIRGVQYELQPSETQLTTQIFLAGDQLLNGSLNAAMIAGERAALGVIKTLEEGLVVEEFTSDSR